MRNFIAAVLLAVFAQALAYADESYVSAAEETETAESAESAREGAGKKEADSQAPRELDV